MHVSPVIKLRGVLSSLATACISLIHPLLFLFLGSAGKEEKIVDYSTRKANVAAAETALWDEELALHTPDAAEAETSVQRQREMEWRFRAKDQEWATLTQIWKFPFVPVPLKKDAAQLK